MGLITINDKAICIGVGKDIWHKTFSEPTFSKRSLTNLTKDKDVIKDIVISQNGVKLSLLTSNKGLCVYKLPNYEIHCYYQLSRAASKIYISEDSQFLLVADKTGDAFIYNLLGENSDGIQVLGHLSLLTDILMSPDNKYIITCDRDEKIRVTNYPETYDIESFCLGHKEFITSIQFLPHNKSYLVSTSGDGTIKIWHYKIGKESLSIQVNNYVGNKDIALLNFKNSMKKDDVEVDALPINHSTCCKMNNVSSMLAVTLHTFNFVLIFQISGVDDSLSYNLVDRISFDEYMCEILLTPNSLWMLFINESVKIEEWIFNETKYSLQCCEVLDKNENLDIKANYSFDITLLYKRKFDNVEEYQKRKKQRLGIN